MRRRAQMKVAALLLLALAAAACSEFGGGTGPISRKIGEVVRDPAAQELDLARLTSFGWDRFYFFPAETSREQICAFIGAGRKHCGRIIRYPVVPAGSVALLFGLDGQLTHAELHALENGRFDLQLSPEGHPRSASVFKIRRIPSSSGRDTVWLGPR
ncbi:hypothetical protein G8A07_10915 [Roseateles sp. DAIF2]|uniref:hypothetical protein n=1 Tax=Roseateles sp. DAIF2 TaxID=2714952 RepID=UPI0018A319F9|nr:hypothetical protein [Roseateles sp. DAIF2]QPF73377.1 hypothetical protein G8A07_10915 [Roseateles sp. DAIF2]